MKTGRQPPPASAAARDCAGRAPANTPPALSLIHIYLVLPESLHSLMGPLGGLCLGFCTDYRYKTAMNCFGALMLGTGIYGLQGAVILRFVDTCLGVVFALVFAALFHQLAAARLLPHPETE